MNNNFQAKYTRLFSHTKRPNNNNNNIINQVVLSYGVALVDVVRNGCKDVGSKTLQMSADVAK